MHSASARKHAASPWAAFVAILTLAPVVQVACLGISRESLSQPGAAEQQRQPVAASLRATKASQSSIHKEPTVTSIQPPPLWQRPVLERAALVNGSLTLEMLKDSGTNACNSVCGSMMDYVTVADVSASVGPTGVLYTKLFLARLLERFRLGQDRGQQLLGLVEAGMKPKLLTLPTDKHEEFMEGVNKLALQGEALNLMAGLGMAETSFQHGRQDAHSLVLAIVDGPALRQGLTVQMAQKLSRSADLVVILVAAKFDVAAQTAAMEWLKAAGSCTPYGCRLLQINDYESLAQVDTTGVIAEICPDLV